MDHRKDVTELYGEHNNVQKTEQPLEIAQAPYPHLDIDGTAPQETINTGETVSSTTNTCLGSS